MPTDNLLKEGEWINVNVNILIYFPLFFC